MALSMIILCEIRHIRARMVISLMLRGRVAIIAIGAYSGRNMLEIKTIADSPGSPMTEKRGVRYPDIHSRIPK